MKTKHKTIEKDFDTVKTFRAIKDRISQDLFGKTAEEIKAYLQTNSLKMKTEK